jgi:hypothetical protein
MHVIGKQMPARMISKRARASRRREGARAMALHYRSGFYCISAKSSNTLRKKIVADYQAHLSSTGKDGAAHDPTV